MAASDCGDSYESVCRNMPRLANGLVNCEKVVHGIQVRLIAWSPAFSVLTGIQCGFGVMCLRNALPQYTVSGAVIVAASNGAAWYAAIRRAPRSPLTGAQVLCPVLTVPTGHL